MEALDRVNWSEKDLRRYEAVEKGILDNLSAEDQRMLDAEAKSKQVGKAAGIKEGL